MPLAALLFIVNDMFENQLKQLKHCLDAINFVQFQNDLDMAVDLLFTALNKNKPILVCGDGDSAADSQHIAGELGGGGFLKDRLALNVRSLSVDTSVITAWANDINYETVFSRQVEANAEAGGVLWAISSSGNSKNVVLAVEKAKELGM